MRSAIRLASLLVALSLTAVGAPAVGTFAQQPSSDEIVRKLAPTPATRSLRGVTVTPGQEPAQPTINLYINFEFDSARLDSDGQLVLKRLAAALEDPRLAGSRFEIAGHTDAVGTAEYNQTLSEERADAVADHLVEVYDIDPTRLVTIGYGKSRLLDPDRPDHGVNRRVQITNLGE